jgi:hypothetical protein
MYITSSSTVQYFGLLCTLSKCGYNYRYHTVHISFVLPHLYCCILVVWTVLYILPLTVKRNFFILVLYYFEYANWIRNGDDEPDNNLRGPRHGMSGDNSDLSKEFSDLHRIKDLLSTSGFQ